MDRNQPRQTMYEGVDRRAVPRAEGGEHSRQTTYEDLDRRDVPRAEEGEHSPTAKDGRGRVRGSPESKSHGFKEAEEDAIRHLARSWSNYMRQKFGIQNVEPNGVLEALRDIHDTAKAVKADDARVPVELWDEAVCRGLPSNEQKWALEILRSFALQLYRRLLWREPGLF